MPLTNEEIIEQGSDLIADTVVLIYDTIEATPQAGELKEAWKVLARRWIEYFYHD